MEEEIFIFEYNWQYQASRLEDHKKATKSSQAHDDDDDAGVCVGSGGLASQKCFIEFLNCSQYHIIACLKILPMPIITPVFVLVGHFFIHCLTGV